MLEALQFLLCIQFPLWLKTESVLHIEAFIKTSFYSIVKHIKLSRVPADKINKKPLPSLFLLVIIPFMFCYFRSVYRCCISQQ